MQFSAELLGNKVLFNVAHSEQQIYCEHFASIK